MYQPCFISLHDIRLISTNFELENNLKISQECRSVLLADLGSSRSTVDDQQAQLDCQATELEDLRVQQRQLKEKIQVFISAGNSGILNDVENNYQSL